MVYLELKKLVNNLEKMENIKYLDVWYLLGYKIYLILGLKILIINFINRKIWEMIKIKVKILNWLGLLVNLVIFIIVLIGMISL